MLLAAKGRPPDHRRAPQYRLLALLLTLVFTAQLGCATSNPWVSVRDTPKNPLAAPLGLLSPGGPRPTPRTRQLLRRFSLLDALDGDRAALLYQLEVLHQQEPDPEHEYAIAELAYLAAKRAEPFDRDEALELYSTALIHSYRYLFDDEHVDPPNSYDPQFRGASDLYNQSLEGLLRIVHRAGELQPGKSREFKTATHSCTLDVVVRSNNWQNEEFASFKFVNDYRIKGLRNHYHSFGLGVPLIAIRKNLTGDHPAEKFYAPNLAFPVTAFLKVQHHDHRSIDQTQLPSPDGEDSTAAAVPHMVLELYDPLEQSTIEINGKQVPLEADLSTPLAYFLSQPELTEANLGTLGLLFPERVKQIQGLYMLEPFDENKMPIVMVHGLWSSPITWMEMFNDLRSDPLVRQHYQFWFYLYPTGRPFWISAAQMRNDLTAMRLHVDPQKQHPALDQTVLVGHSMGGLVSKLQSVSSRNDFWQTMTTRPFENLVANANMRETLAETYFFQPNPGVRRVVTIGTPHLGSRFSNGVTRWLSDRVIDLPSRMLRRRKKLVANNDGYFLPTAPLDVRTSIDSLDPASPLLPVLVAAEPAPWVTYHNIFGRVPNQGWQERFVGEGDGVVAIESARLEPGRQLKSQLEVAAEHVAVHRHPQSILEVRRVLLEQLAELQNFPYGIQVTSFESDVAGTASPRSPPSNVPPPGQDELTLKQHLQNVDSFSATVPSNPSKEEPKPANPP